MHASPIILHLLSSYIPVLHPPSYILRHDRNQISSRKSLPVESFHPTLHPISYCTTGTRYPSETHPLQYSFPALDHPHPTILHLACRKLHPIKQISFPTSYSMPRARYPSGSHSLHYSFPFPVTLHAPPALLHLLPPLSPSGILSVLNTPLCSQACRWFSSPS